MISGLYTLAALQELIAAEPHQWRPLVLTNGCFDLLHAGHVRYLQKARQMGRSLVVGLNSDRSIQIIKPAHAQRIPRPIQPQTQRAEVLAALKAVDAVTIFDQPTACEVVAMLQPEVYVKGGDYRLEDLPETPSVLSYGGQVKLIKIEVSTSTSKIIERILTVQSANNEQTV
jgi:rfaE bifunctional protein nucleotidyltransferase chain/domain